MERNDYLAAGQAIMEFQLKLMRDALSATAALASANTKGAASYGSRYSDLRLATTSQLASANREYVERMQENVDSMLHALAMAPVAADRVIRAAAAASERPSSAAAGTTPARPARSRAGKARRPQRGDHAG